MHTLLYFLGSFCIVFTHTLYVAAIPFKMSEGSFNGYDIGLVVASFAIGTIFGRIISVVSAGKNTTKFMWLAIFMLIFSQLGYLFFGINLELTVFRFLNGVAHAYLFYYLFLSMPTNHNEASRLIGALGAGSATALLLGGALGLVSAKVGALEFIYFLGILSALVVGIIFTKFLRQPTIFTKTSKDETATNTFLDLRLYIIVISVLLFMSVLGGLEVIVPMLTNDIGYYEVLIVFVTFSLTFIIGRFMGGGALVLRERLRVLLPICLSACLLCGLVSLNITFLFLFLAAILTGLSLGISNTFLMGLAGQGFDGAERSNRLISGQIASDIGLALGASLASFIFFYNNREALLVVTGSFILGTVLLAIASKLRPRANPSELSEPKIDIDNNYDNSTNY